MKSFHYGVNSAEFTQIPLLCEFEPKEPDTAANTQEEEGLWGNGQHKPEAVLCLEKCPE